MSGRTIARAWVLCCILLSVEPFLFSQAAPGASTEADESAERDHPAEREKWFMQGRVAPKGKTPAEMRWQAYQQKIQMRAARMVAARHAATAGIPKAAAASTGWTALGPAPLVSDPGTGQDYGFVSGRAIAVAIDPADATGNTVYIGGAYGGLWRSTNGLAGGFGNPSGVAWTPMIDTMGTLAVGAIAIQPANATGTLSNVILVGTGEANSSADSYYGLGILRSIDQGKNWNLIKNDNQFNPFHGLAFSKIAFSTTSTSTVVAATATSSLGVLDGARSGGEQRGIYVSTDAGATWNFETSVKDGATSINPLTNSVTSVVFNAGAGKFYAAFRYHGFYSSTDGASWTRLAVQPAGVGVGLNSAATCPTTLLTNITCPIYRGEIAVVPGRNEMYVWYTDPGDGDQGIWKTTNGGTSWTKINDSSITSCGDTFGGCGTAQGGYDLELLAVPNGATNTDVYAGARNLYKCTITAASPTCSSAAEPNFFMNLTHVYGCNSIAKVHPDQHHLDAVVAGGKAVMYFANDGGVYRAVDGFAGLHTGVCGSTNQFDSLDGTLGSMTEFVSMSQDATDPNTVLGGTQDNGSPSSSTARTSSQFHSVLGGDGGYNEINPTTSGASGQWFTSNPPFTNNGVPFHINIYSCSLGSGCLDGNFGNTTQNSTIGGDIAPFYPFFMLDPQAPSKMIIGTSCRLWRGDVSSGIASGFVALTDSFDAAGAVPCTGNEINQVHAADAGGPTDANGSKVVYAVTEGTGPLQGPNGVPTGGEVWRSTNASGGTGTFSNVTSTINPNHFSIGAVAVDPSDATGMTAYVGIQGFHAEHVFKTTNGGTTWSDFTGIAPGTFPDAPVNSIVLDSAAGVVYAGTDVGVFSSSVNSPSWTEVGPAPAPGVSGYLPDAPVTKVRLFNSGGAKLLRASTYGRGIWEFVIVPPTPDFSISASFTSATAYVNQVAALTGTLTALNGYNKPVTLSCTGAKPSTCSATPNPVTPAATGTAITVNAASGTAGTFTFNIHAADAASLAHDGLAVFRVVNITLGPLSPSTVAINVPNTSAPITIPFTRSNSLPDAINFSCPNAPAHVTCSFSPNPVQGGTNSTMLTITAGSGATLVNNFALVIAADDTSVTTPSSRTINLPLTLTANPDYTLAIGSATPPAITVQGQQPFNGTLTAINGDTTPVSISCVAGTTAPPATCLVTTSPTTPTTGGANFTVLAADTVATTYNFKVHTTDGTITHDLPVTLVLDPDFHIINTTSTQTVTAGGTATFTPLTFKPDGQGTLANDISLTCSGLPSLSTCTFNPTKITSVPPTGSADVALTIRTTAAVASGARPSLPWKPSGPLFAFWLSLPALGIVSITAHRQTRKRFAMIGGLLVLGLVVSFAGCGGGGSGHQGQPGTPPGSYTITVNAAAATPGIAKQTTTVKMVVQ